jgi:hypothetical protein
MAANKVSPCACSSVGSFVLQRHAARGPRKVLFLAESGEGSCYLCQSRQVKSRPFRAAQGIGKAGRHARAFAELCWLVLFGKL